MARYFERTRTLLERHHGLVQKLIGDAVVAVFGVLVAREDDALRAVRAAAAMQDAVAELDAGGPAIEVRIGVGTGEVMVEEAGGDPLVIGDAVNLATRLQAAAGPGEVLMDRRTWHLSRDALVAAPVNGGGGRVDSLETWRLVDVSPDALGHARHHDNPLVGRQAELQLFDWVFQRAVRGSTCHLLTVLGPAGVGKSRLVAAALDALDDQATALYGQCPSDAEGSTFWPVAEIIRRAAEIKSADSPEQGEAKLDELLAGEPDGAQISDRLSRLVGLDSYLRCLIGRAEDEFQRAVDHAARAGDERFEAGNLYALVQAAFWGPTPAPEGIRRCQQIRERAEGSYRVEMSALHTLAGLHAMQGRFELARELGEAAAAIAGKLGPSRFAALCSQFLGQVELLAGDPAAAERWLRWGSGILERMGERGLRSELTANLARALAAQGRDDEAIEAGILAGELAVRDDLYAQVERRGPMAAALARQGRLAEAERLAAEAVEMARASDMLGMPAGALLDLAGVLRLAGRTGEAQPLLREAIKLAERKGHLVAAAQARHLLADRQAGRAGGSFRPQGSMADSGPAGRGGGSSPAGGLDG